MNKEQFQLLKKINCQKKYYYSPDESDMILYLRSLGYISTHTENGDRWGANATKFCIATESGKAHLFERKCESRNKWIPYIITTAISVLSLMKSYGCGIDDIFIWCMQLLKQLLQAP